MGRKEEGGRLVTDGVCAAKGLNIIIINMSCAKIYSSACLKSEAHHVALTPAAVSQRAGGDCVERNGASAASQPIISWQVSVSSCGGERPAEVVALRWRRRLSCGTASRYNLKGRPGMKVTSDNKGIGALAPASRKYRRHMASAKCSSLYMRM